MTTFLVSQKSNSEEQFHNKTYRNVRKVVCQTSQKRQSVFMCNELLILWCRHGDISSLLWTGLLIQLWIVFICCGVIGYGSEWENEKLFSNSCRELYIHLCVNIMLKHMHPSVFPSYEINRQVRQFFFSLGRPSVYRGSCVQLIDTLLVLSKSLVTSAQAFTIIIKSYFQTAWFFHS